MVNRTFNEVAIGNVHSTERKKYRTKTQNPEKETESMRRCLSTQTLCKMFNGPESCAQQPNSRW